MNPETHFRAIAPLYMRQLIKDFPTLSEMDAAAIFGNAGHESKGLTDDQEDKPVVKGSRGGLNWMQWTGPRRRALEAFAKRNNLDPTGDKAAYLWLVKELQGEEKKAIPAILAASGLRNKVVAFEKAFLRAGVKHYDKRLAWAKIALEELQRPAKRVQTPAPKEPSTGPAAFPVKGARNDEVVAQVQRRLKELGYSETGNIDGDFGDLTEKAILIFRHDAGLPLSGAIDSNLIVTLAKAKPREMPAGRAEATPKEVREVVPEAKSNWWSKVAGFWSTIVGAVIAFFNWAIGSFADIRDFVQPMLDLLAGVPVWVYALAFAGGALWLYLNGRKGEAASVEAVQEGARR